MGKPSFLDNVRMFIGGIGWDIFLWSIRMTNQQYMVSSSMLIYLCNNPECGWVGWEPDATYLKHDADMRLCPECRETCEHMTPEWVVDLYEESEPKTNAHTSTEKVYPL